MNTPAGTPPASSPLSQTAEPWALQKRTYQPLADTLAIYAGWLLAWYIAIVAITELATLRSLDIVPEFFHEVVASMPLFLSALACFLFLLGLTLHKLFHRNIFAGFLLLIIGVGAFALYFINIR